MQRPGLGVFVGRLSALILLCLTLFCFQNCDSYHSEFGLSSNGIGAGMTLQVDQNSQTQSLAILSSNCASCHDTASSGGVTQILDVYHLIGVGLIVPGDPTQGRIIGSIQAGTMPLGGSVSAADLLTLKNWILSMRLVAGGTSPVSPPPSLLPAGKAVQADTTLHAQAMNIININCAGCHQGVASGGINNILDINQLVLTGLVTAGDPTQGRLIGAITAGTMPYGNGPPVKASDLQILKDWISSMTIVDASLNLPPMPIRVALAPTFASVFANVIQPKCVACHLNLNSYSSVKSGAGGILSKCQSGSMPKAPFPVLTNAEMTALQSWIQGGALNN